MGNLVKLVHAVVSDIQDWRVMLYFGVFLVIGGLCNVAFCFFLWFCCSNV